MEYKEQSGYIIKNGRIIVKGEDTLGSSPTKDAFEVAKKIREAWWSSMARKNNTGTYWDGRPELKSAISELDDINDPLYNLQLLVREIKEAFNEARSILGKEKNAVIQGANRLDIAIDTFYETAETIDKTTRNQINQDANSKNSQHLKNTQVHKDQCNEALLYYFERLEKNHNRAETALKAIGDIIFSTIKNSKSLKIWKNENRWATNIYLEANDNTEIVELESLPEMEKYNKAISLIREDLIEKLEKKEYIIEKSKEANTL